MSNAENFAKKIFGTRNISSIEKFNISFQKKYKIVVFLPQKFTEKVSEAMAKAGAGIIGKYSECTFRLNGTGTFKSSKDSNPFAGKKGVLERVEETRLEMVCSHESLNRAVSAMLKIHPYEEPAYDIYEILSGTKEKNAYAVKVVLKSPVPFQKILSTMNDKIDDSLIPKNLKQIKLKRAVVDFSGNDSVLDYIHKSGGKTLYITKIFKRQINIRLI